MTITPSTREKNGAGLRLELFPCSGGVAEGFRRAGVTFDYSFDVDPDACDSYEQNHGHRPIQMDVQDLLRMLQGGAWVAGRPVDLLVADPPCTPWSRSGKRKGLEDERDMLLETAAIIELLAPRAWLIGNVPGLDDADHWKSVVQPVLGGLARRTGFCVDYASLDAADYGVPQHRVRPFWFGHPSGTPCLRWPDPTHGDWTTARLDGRAPWKTCKDALQHLSAEDLGRPVRLRWKDGVNGPNHRPSRANEPAATLTKNTHSDGTILIASKEDVRERHLPNKPDAPSGVVRVNGGLSSGGASTLEWPWDRPSTTVNAEDRIMPPGHHDGSNLSQPNAVILSEKAAAILQGFPESWVFSGATKKARWSQIGQAMPPGLMEPVARQIARWFDGARSWPCPVAGCTERAPFGQCCTKHQEPRHAA